MIKNASVSIRGNVKQRLEYAEGVLVVPGRWFFQIDHQWNVSGALACFLYQGKGRANLPEVE